jgi:hypothetical protein
MLYKFYLILAFFKLFCGFSVAVTHGKDGNIQIIFATVEPSTEWISGRFHHPQPTRGRWHAFLIPPGHELGWKTGGLISFNHRSEIVDRGFEFRYLTDGEWVVGAFQDLNRNTLLDLGVEPFYIAAESPVLFSGEAVFVEFGVRERKVQELSLRDFPGEYPWAVQIMDDKKRPLFARSFNLPELSIFDALPPFYFTFAEDRNENGFLEEGEFEDHVYELARPLPEGAFLSYAQTWLPVSIGIEKPEELDFFLVQAQLSKGQGGQNSQEIQKEGSFRLPLISDGNSDFWYYDLPAGEYQLEFALSSKGPFFRSRAFEHPAVKKPEFVFSADYKVQCRREVSRTQVAVSYEENMPVYLNGQEFCGISLFQSGSYRATFYDYFPLPEGQSFPEHSYLMPLQNVEIYNFSLDKKNSIMMLDELVMENAKTGKINGQYKFGREVLPEGVKLYFFQYPPGMRNMEILSSLDLSTGSFGDTSDFSFDFDGRDFFAFVDFNGNILLDEEERVFSRVYGKELAAEPFLLEFPGDGNGLLQVSLDGPYPERHFLEVYLAEESAESGSPPLAASFLSSSPLVFGNIPRLLKLRLKLVFDINDNSLFDEEDIFYQEKEILISSCSQILKLHLQAEAGQLSIETRPD